MYCGNDFKAFAVSSNINQTGFPVASAQKQKRRGAEERKAGWERWSEVGKRRSDKGQREGKQSVLRKQEGDRKKTKAEKKRYRVREPERVREVKKTGGEIWGQTQAKPVGSNIQMDAKWSVRWGESQQKQRRGVRGAGRVSKAHPAPRTQHQAPSTSHLPSAFAQLLLLPERLFAQLVALLDFSPLSHLC